jgi:hypothetical protein
MSKKIEAFWQDATAKDVERVMAGETVEARFRDDDTEPWSSPRDLRGWSHGKWISSFCWSHCEVYREPSWYTNKPEPGEGFRLLEKFPDEELKPGDEAWDVWNDKQWRMSDSANGRLPQGRDIWYRRRIEPVEPKFSVGQTVKVIGPKEIPALEWSSVGMAQYAGTTQTIERVELLTNPPGTYYHLKGVVNWCFREDYLEPVEPEPKHYVLRVGDSVETPNGHRVEVISRSETQRFWSLNAGDKLTLPNGQTITITAKGFEVTQ